MIKVEKHNWQPSFPNEIWITEGNRQGKFTITLKQNNDIEIEFEWDYGYGGRGAEHISIPASQLKGLINEIYPNE